MNRLAFAAIALGLGAVPAAASEPECFQNENFLVIAQERADDVGSDFLVREPAKGKIACVFAEQPGDVRIGEAGDPLHFNNLVANYLVLDRSTGPDGELVIYDLAATPPMRMIDVAVDDDVAVEDGRIIYWERVAEGTEDNCPEFAEYSGYGFGAVIAEGRIFDTATGTATATDESRCSSTQ